MRIVVAGVHGSSGIDSYTRTLANALAATGHSVLLVDRTGREAPAPGGPIELFTLEPPGERLRRALGPIEAFAHHHTLRTVARSWKADVFHATQPELAPRMPEVVVTAWDPESSIRVRYRLARERRLHRRREEALYALSDAIAMRRAAAVVAVTSQIATALKHPKVAWIPGFLDDDAILAPPASRTRDCVFVAHNLADRNKDLPLALETLRLVRQTLPDARLVLVGGGAPASLPDFCDVRGRLERDAVAAVVRGAGCCLITSAWEEFGYGGLEALAVGTPLACPPLPAFADLGSSDGVFIAKRTAQGLARAVVEAVSTTSFGFPEAFRASRAVPRLVELYASIA